jgi:hypothetical protein
MININVCEVGTVVVKTTSNKDLLKEKNTQEVSATKDLETKESELTPRKS